jgi:hypothetical protein
MTPFRAILAQAVVNIDSNFRQRHSIPDFAELSVNMDLSPAEQAVVDHFTQQLGLALRRMAGVNASAPAAQLPQAVPTDRTHAATSATSRKSKLPKEHTFED